jgi:peroxiredoxin
MARLQVGDLAPDITLVDGKGQEVSLASHWKRSAVLLVFLRHFG